jgi:metallo-beta-lactamase class B
VTLGDTTVTIYITPGHTAGTLSVLVPVKDHGQPHLAMEWGGTALSRATSKEMLESYISNAKRMKDISDGLGADVIIGNHTEYNDALARMERTRARKAGDPNPWIVGKGEVDNYLTVVEECAKSWLAIGAGRP